MNKEEIKNKLFKLISFIMSMILLIIGSVILYYLISSKNNLSDVDKLLRFIVTIIFVIIGFMLQLILHEAGHLICGIWSGYGFVSFRVRKITFVKENDKIVIKKLKIKGTGGQCLMMPPEGNGYDSPYIFYSLGGILINALVSVLCIVIYITCPMNEIVAIFFIVTAILGVLFLIINGIPMKSGVISNDGYNVIALGKDKIVRYSFYIQLRVNGLIYQGMRMKDIPVSLFELPSDADLNNSLISSLKIYEANYYQDRKEFGKAREVLEKLLNDAPGLIEIYKNEIKCEILFYEIIGEGREEIINSLYTKELKDYINATCCYIARKRLMYAYELIIDKDLYKANKILTEFENVAKTYPLKSEIESEREIIEIIKIIGDK